jgi:hypothetical protein
MIGIPPDGDGAFSSSCESAFDEAADDVGGSAETAVATGGSDDTNEDGKHT